MRVDGSNTLRVEHYVNRGDEASSPSPFDGTHTYDEIGLNLNHSPSAYDTRRAQVFGVLNYSDYRSQYEDFSVERWNLFQEKGDFAVPYRIEAGDIYSYLSYRTQSRTLKGAQAEFQPDTNLLNIDHSLMAFIGANQPAWREFAADENYSTGFSWLMQGVPILGSISLNQVYNNQEPNPELNTLRREQHIFGLAFEQVFPLADQELTLEGEYAHFLGDHSGVQSPEDGQGRNENGYFAQLSGKSERPLTYRFRFELYGKDFRPDGAQASPNRQSWEAHLGWRFKSGMQLRGRYQDFWDNIEDGDRTVTDVFGLDLTGPLLRPWVDDLSGALGGFVRFTEDEDDTVDDRTSNINLSVSKPIWRGWNMRPSLFLQDSDNRLPGGGHTDTWQASLSADHSLAIFGFDGSVSPGVQFRRTRGRGSDTDDWGPSAAVALARGPHSFSLNTGFLTQQRHLVGATDVETWNTSVSYNFTSGAHVFGLEFDHFSRDPFPGRDTDAYRFALFWTWNFGCQLGGRKPRVEARRRDAGGRPSAHVGLLTRIAPGTSLEDAIGTLTEAGLTGAARLPDALVYEVRLIRDLDQRQRLALVHNDKKEIEKVLLIVDFDDVGNLDTSVQTFEKVRSELISRLGKPTTFLEEGDFDASFAGKVNSSQFIRINEWGTRTGLLRFGIPRRLDRVVRMEIQHASKFPGPREPLWSVERVR